MKRLYNHLFFKEIEKTRNRAYPMDAWERMFRDEEERDLFFIQEEMSDMEQSDTHELRKWARDLYGQAAESTPEEAIALQCIIQTRIAEHLARIAEALEKISKRLEES